MCGFCGGDDRIHRSIKRLVDAWILGRENAFRHPGSPLVDSSRSDVAQLRLKVGINPAEIKFSSDRYHDSTRTL
jgi:hypothetical protein